MGRFSETVKLSPSLAKSRYARFMDRLERYFQLMTYGVLAVAGAWMVVSISSERLAHAMGSPTILEVPYKLEDRSVPPILKKIAKCEGVTQFDKKGNVVKGRVNKSDIGLLQINEKIWGAKAKELGYNIYTEEGNIAMGKWLLANYGSAKWYLSSACWNR